MSKKAYCPRGGQEGIYVTISELKRYAKKSDRKYIDEVIPLPLHGKQPDPKNCTNGHGFGETYYWENNEGGHGWCCAECGQVLQWG